MSADNWGVCPKCESLENRFAIENHLHAPSVDNSLREDYELGIVKGEFYVFYKGQCDCGFSFKFNHKEKIKL